MEQPTTYKSDSTATSKHSKNNPLSQNCKSFNKRWFTTVSKLKAQLQFEKEHPEKIPKNSENLGTHPIIREEESETKLTPLVNLAGLNTKDDSYMITPDGKFLVFLTYYEIIKYSLETFQIV